MQSRRVVSLVLGSLLCCLIPLSALAQGRPDPKALQAAQSGAMAALSFMDGVWRGPAWAILPSGEKHHLTQTERIGPFLGGAVKVIEGRGYEPDGSVAFNAFGTVSYSPATRKYTLHSYALGQVGDFEFTALADGYSWKMPAGPVATIVYTATITADTFVEVGDFMEPGKEPARIFEMRLKRVGNTDWPAAGAVPPR